MFPKAIILINSYSCKLFSRWIAIKYCKLFLLIYIKSDEIFIELGVSLFESIHYLDSD